MPRALPWVGGSGQGIIKDAKIDASSSGDNEVVAAVAGKRLVVTSILLVASAAVSVKFRSASTDKTGAMSLAVNGGFSADADWGLFATSVGEALNINLSAAEAVGGCLTYVEL